MPGPPKKPPSLKAIAGTVRPFREVAAGMPLPVLDAAPPAPDWLSVHAVKEWDRLAPMLVANGLLTEGGLSALAVLCALLGDLVRSWAAGIVPKGALLAQYRGLCNDFGLTPIAQGKVRGAEATSAGNRFAGNGRRPGA